MNRYPLLALGVSAFFYGLRVLALCIWIRPLISDDSADKQPG